MTVDGNYWQGDNIQAWDFLSKGFAQCNQWLRPNPPTSSSVTGMLSCWRQSWAHNFNVPDVPWADYQVYIYVVKDWSPSRPYNVDLFLEGQQLTTITTGSAGEWQRVGPFPVRVTDGALTIRTRGGVLNIAGIEIWN
jgi:chitinase